MGWSEIVRTLRRHCGGKQETISILIGVSQATISRWESGRQLPAKPFRDKILDLHKQIVEQAEAREPPPVSVPRLLGGASIGMIKADSVRVLEANDTFLRMTGYSRKDLAEGVIVWPAMTSLDRGKAGKQAVRELIRLGEFAPIEKEVVCKDGGLLTVLIAGIVVQRDPLQVVCSIIRLSDGVSSQSRPADMVRGMEVGGATISCALFGMSGMPDLMRFLLL